MHVYTRIPVPALSLSPTDAERPQSGSAAPVQLPAPGANGAAEETGGIGPLIRLTALTLGADVATVSLVHTEGMLLESEVRLPDLRATRRCRPLSTSLARHIVDSGAPFVVHDVLACPRDAEVPLPADGIRSYLGVPLCSSGAEVSGTLSVAGYAPRRWAPAEIEVLHIIAGSMVAEIDLRGEVRRLERVGEERAVSERRSALQQLALGLRHELNNALAGLVLEAELLAGGGAGYERFRESVASIQSQVWRIQEVLHRLDDVDALRTKPYLDRGLMIDLSEQGRLL
jgi:GAF domain-containing protein